MGRVGVGRDDASMEKFFSRLQENVPDRSLWATHTEVRVAIAT